MTRFYIVGGYKGMKEKFNKKISPYFNKKSEALHYKQCYGVFSLSLAQGTIKEEQL